MISDIIYNLIQKISFIKKYKLYDFSKNIVYPFLIKNVSKLFKSDIDEKLIVMGGYYGGAFLGTPKYLFEFLNKNSDYKLVWMAKLRDVAKEISKKGFHVASFYSFTTIKLLRKAKYIFVSHGVGDVLPIKFSPKTIIVLTWHGTPIKRINIDLDKWYIYSKWADFFRLKFKHDDYVDYLLTPTKDKREHEILRKAFKLSPGKILALGYPKLDFLFDKDKSFILNLKKSYQIPDNMKKIILYCPTWRDDFTLDFPFEPSQLKKLNDLLEETNTLFLIKAHMFVKEINFDDYCNIRITPKNANIEELYLITDILITDYSSTMLDFSLLDRPILLFAYDLNNYLEIRGLYYNLEDIAPGPIFYNAEDLINGIKRVDEINMEYLEKRIKIKKIFNKFNDGKSTERILNFLKIKYINK